MLTARLAVLSMATFAALTVSSAQASDKYAFPSASGISIGATPHFSQPMEGAKLTFAVTPGAPADLSAPLPPVTPYQAGRGSASERNLDAYAFRFFTQGLGSQSYRNYASDYYRLFAPGFAVSTWTDRMFGMVDAGYGGAVDGWTAASYYMGRVRGPVRRRETAPDLSIMPTFRAHPELSAPPTFNKTN